MRWYKGLLGLSGVTQGRDIQKTSELVKGPESRLNNIISMKEIDDVGIRVLNFDGRMTRSESKKIARSFHPLSLSRPCLPLIIRGEGDTFHCS